METIHGHVERITFQNPENGFTVAQIKEAKKRDLTCAVGTMPGVRPGETVSLQGEWVNDLVHGRQFRVQHCEIRAPADVLGIKKYLGSGLIKGIGPKYAAKIVQKFGADTLAIIDHSPERLAEVPGISKKRVASIKDCWDEQRCIRDVMLFLQQWEVSPSYAQKIFKKYGKDSIEVVSNNPYRLSRDIFGIGFKTADKIASRMGIAKDSVERIDAGVEHVLSTLCDDGHVCYPINDFLEIAANTLEVEAGGISERMQELYLEERIVIQELLSQGDPLKFVWIRPLFLAEKGIAKQSERIRFASCNLRKVDVDKAISWVEERLHLELADNQKTAVQHALQDKMLVITGGPGTGKSTITNAILTITSLLTDKIILAAPTGRAAKRMKEITGRQASTIHSLLEFSFAEAGFKKNRENPLDCDLIIVDEASMIDTLLMNSLLKAIPDHARVVFVGDINQLPSVGAGNVLKDMISSQVIPVVQLNQIFRQAAGSRIITNAHLINKGRMPDVRAKTDSDFFFIQAEDYEQVTQTVLGLVSQRLPKRYGFHPINEIQVLAPMKRGPIGTENLNLALQRTLNSESTPFVRAGRSFLIGDKVMQIRNNYDKEVFNGDVGRIKDIDLEDQVLAVVFDDRELYYEAHEIDELVLAYAVSVHKYQGSECPCIVMPIHTAHYKLLTRNLLYTGVTRGKKLVVLVGNMKGLGMAVRNDEVRLRHTGLRHALMDSDRALLGI